MKNTIKLLIIAAALFSAAAQAEIRRTQVSTEWDSREVLDFTSLPFDRAIVRVKGDGSRKMAIFGDPHCPQTKKVERELAKITNITIYTFPGAFVGGQRSQRDVQQVFCQATNQARAKAWESLVLGGKEPPAVPNCSDDQGDQIRASFGNLQSSVGPYQKISPTMIFQNHLAFPGPLPREDIETMLDHKHE
jgi:thiol:disulfide interchange protein DsbC